MKNVILITGLVGVAVLSCNSLPKRLPGGDNLPQVAHDIAIAVRYKHEERLKEALKDKDSEAFAFNNPLCKYGNCLLEALNDIPTESRRVKDGDMGKEWAVYYLVAATPAEDIRSNKQEILDKLVNAKYGIPGGDMVVTKLLEKGADFSKETYRYTSDDKKKFEINGDEFLCLSFNDKGKPRFKYPESRSLRSDLYRAEYAQSEHITTGWREWKRTVEMACTDFAWVPGDKRGYIVPIAEIEGSIRAYASSGRKMGVQPEVHSNYTQAKKAEKSDGSRELHKVCPIEFVTSNSGTKTRRKCTQIRKIREVYVAWDHDCGDIKEQNQVDSKILAGCALGGKPEHFVKMGLRIPARNEYR